MKRSVAILLMTCMLLASLPPRSVRADIAPPDFPSGANPVPEGESTQVRMLAETVTLELLTAASPYAPVSPAMARTTAVFSMQNMGEAAETMWVRFPLTNWTYQGDPYNEDLEVRDLTVKVDGKAALTKRVMEPDPRNLDSEMPWAAFQVTFQPGKPVEISVSYQSDAQGELNYAVFRYTLETGAGWKDTIGSVDMVVRLPYAANEQNIVFDGWTGFGDPTPGAVFSGNEARWHFENLEPQFQDNFMAILLTPASWKAVLLERENTTKNPQYGEAWGRLGKDIKAVIFLRKGVRSDPGGLALYQEAVQAYEKSLSLLPNDSLWHFGYAELLWNQWFWNVHWTDPTDVSNLVRALQHLQTALQIDPNNQRARDLLDNISYSVPEYVRRDENGNLDLLVLTATPEHFTLTPWPSETPVPTNTPIPSATPAPSETPLPATASSTLVPSATAVPAEPSATNAPQQPAATATASGQGGIQICGVAFMPPALLGLAMLRRKTMR